MTTLVVDTSAAFAIIAAESGYEDLIIELEAANQRLMSAATLVELGIVVEGRFGPSKATTTERFIRDADISVIPLTGEQAQRALDGWRSFGKGRHKAALNLGDCYTYGLASSTGFPVLCTGDDFVATDLDVRPDR